MKRFPVYASLAGLAVAVLLADGMLVSRIAGPAAPAPTASASAPASQPPAGSGYGTGEGFGPILWVGVDQAGQATYHSMVQTVTWDMTQGRIIVVQPDGPPLEFVNAEQAGC